MSSRLSYFWFGCVLSCFGSCKTASAQESRPVPAYGDYMEWCVKGAQPAGGYGSSVDKAFEEARCHCINEHLPMGVMSKKQFFNAGKSCQQERSQGPEAFTQKYYARINRVPSRAPAPAQVSQADATFKYRSGTIFLGPDCKASSTQYGKGTWGWANGGIMVNLEKKKDIGFARAESPYPDGRCQL